MLKLEYGRFSNIGFVPNPWGWSEEPFPAFRGEGQRYRVFLAVAKGFKPWFNNTFDNIPNEKKQEYSMSDDYSKIITTRKGTQLLVPCGRKQDERILLITAVGGFRGAFGRIEAHGAELVRGKRITMHCYPCAHLIVRITDPDGYILTETGHRTNHGEVGIYSWKGGYFSMETKEYEAKVKAGTLFEDHNKIESELTECQQKRKAQEESLRRREEFLPKLREINERIKKLHEVKEIDARTSLVPFDFSDDMFFTKTGYKTKHLYCENEIANIEKDLQYWEDEIRLLKARNRWEPEYKKATIGFKFPEIEDPWGNKYVSYYSNAVVVLLDTYKKKYYKYSACYFPIQMEIGHYNRNKRSKK